MKYLWLLLLPIFVHAKELKDLSRLFEGLKPLALKERVIKSTEVLLNSPTGLGPLGEASGLDPNPLFSLEKFDCTTYVETNLALAFAEKAEDVVPIMSRIRYQGDSIDYFQRNHFMVSDWIPSNSKKGFVSEFTQQLTQEKSAYQSARKNFSRTVWFYHRAIDLLDAQKKQPKEILDQLAKIPIITNRDERSVFLLSSYFRSNYEKMLNELPEVSIVMFIRNIPSSPTLVNHMGFLIKKNNKIFLNHAPQTKPWRVQEILLEDYFKEMDNHRAPIDGLILLRVGRTASGQSSI